MTLIRWGQPGITRVTPQNANRRFLIPQKATGIPPRAPFQFRMAGDSYIVTPLKLSSEQRIKIEFDVLYTGDSVDIRFIGNELAAIDDLCIWMDASGVDPLFFFRADGLGLGGAGAGDTSPGVFMHFIMEANPDSLLAMWAINGVPQTTINYGHNTDQDNNLNIGDFGVMLPSGFGLSGVIKNVQIDVGITGTFNHQYYIDDNSNTIKDSIGTADAVLTPGSGAWEAAP